MNLLFLMMLAVIVPSAIVFLKERKMRTKVSAECSKIDQMLAEGKISRDESEELKKAVGHIPVVLEKNRPDIHIKFVGYLHLALILPVASIIFVAVSINSPNIQVPTEIASSVSTLLSIYLLVFILIFFALLIAPFAVLKLKNWGRYMVIMLALFELWLFPLGTALGLYSLWVLLVRDGAKEYFTERDEIKIDKRLRV